MFGWQSKGLVISLIQIFEKIRTPSCTNLFLYMYQFVKALHLLIHAIVSNCSGQPKRVTTTPDLGWSCGSWGCGGCTQPLDI